MCVTRDTEQTKKKKPEIRQFDTLACSWLK